MPKVEDLAERSIGELGLTPEVAAELAEIRAELAEQYRDSFNEMLRVIARQAAAIDRLQRMMEAFIEASNPEVLDRVRAPVLKVAEDGEDPDVTAALVVPDPIGAGFTLSQAGLAQALGLSQPTVSVLTRILKLREAASCAVAVRSGDAPVHNYHPRAVSRFRELLDNPPPGLSDSDLKKLERAQRQIRKRQTKS